MENSSFKNPEILENTPRLLNIKDIMAAIETSEVSIDNKLYDEILLLRAFSTDSDLSDGVYERRISIKDDESTYGDIEDALRTTIGLLEQNLTEQRGHYQKIAVELDVAFAGAIYIDSDDMEYPQQVVTISISKDKAPYAVFHTESGDYIAADQLRLYMDVSNLTDTTLREVIATYISTHEIPFEIV